MYKYSSRVAKIIRALQMQPRLNCALQINHNNDSNDGIYSSAFPQSGSSPPVISVPDIGQVANTEEIPLLFSRKCGGFFKVPLTGLVDVGELDHGLKPFMQNLLRLW